MSCNVGGMDRALRIFVGIAIIAWGVMTENVWGVIGFVPLITGLVKWCPLYPLLGIKTCEVKKAD